MTLVKHSILTLTLASALIMSACGTTRTKTTTNAFTVPKSSKALVFTPDVELKVLMASGMTETRADWSQQGVDNLSGALKDALGTRGASVSFRDRNANLTPRQVQLVKLTDTVTQTSLRYDYIGQKLPTHEGQYNRTIGPGAAELAGDSGADYSLMVVARGSFSSGGKIAMNIAMAALGGPVQIGGQSLYATLIDLKTGDIVWSNFATAAANADMRSPQGAEVLVESLLKDFPLSAENGK